MKRIFLIFLIFVLLAPGFSMAALNLEQIYPSFSQGGQEITVTGKTSIIGIVKYYSTWAIVISILVVIISLIIGGFQYLTSAGKPDAMTNARKRITKAFLGLAILTTSYMALRIVNPQLHLLQIKKVPISSGVVVFTKRGIEGDPCNPPVDTCDTAGDDGDEEHLEGIGLDHGTSLEELVELNQAKYLSSNIIDLTKELGRMVSVEYNGGDFNNPSKLNFEDVPLYAIGFWGKDAENIKVITYTEKRFEDANPNEYTIDGKINWNWEIEKPSVTKGSEPEFQVIILEDHFPSSKVDFVINKTDTIPSEEVEVSWKDAPSLPHPPLSMTIVGIGPGVYLYSESEQTYFVSANADLSIANFDDRAEEIEIKNTDPRPDKLSATHNYLAILFDEPGFRGSFRIFFEKAKDKFVSELYWEEDDFRKDIRPTQSGTTYQTLATVKLDDRKNDVSIWKDSIVAGEGHFQGAYEIRNTDYTIGNVPKSDINDPENSKAKVNAVDQYGKVSGVSSIMVLELDNKSTCKEVRLCNEKFGKGKCLSYTNTGNLRKGVYDTFNLPMPWYAPVNLPAVVEGTVQIRADKDGNRTEKLKPYSNDVMPTDVMFKRNIRSIIIDGNCLVALYKNPVDDLRDCLTVDGSEPKTDKCWKKDTPSESSEIFTETDPDLTDNVIGACPARDVGRFGIGKIAPCTAAIAVYPVK